MDNLFQNSSGETSEHPTREMLLLSVDGELQTKEAAQLEAHLEACWPCRVKTQKIQDAIADIIEFDDQVLTPRLVPPRNWSNFDRKFSQLVADSGKQSLSSRFFGSLSRFIHLRRLFESGLRSFRPAFVRAAVAIVLVAVISTLAVRFLHEPIVSASQLLNNAVEAQAVQARSITDPVIHQKLRIARKNQAREQVVDWEIWNDTKNSRIRQFLVSHDQKTNSASDLVNEFAQVLRINQMDPVSPLSAASYQSWHTTLQPEHDEITKSKLADGNDALTLRTVVAQPVNIGRISEATFTVREKDWLPAELHMTVATENGSQSYELTQTTSEVVSLAQVSTSLFADQPTTPSPNAIPKEVAKNETRPSPAVAANPEPLNPSPLATAELEVETLRLLNQAQADLGEQIVVKRQADGLLHITGIVETDKRKAEISAALSPISGNPSVRIEIQTVAEAVSKQTSNKPTPQPSTRAIEITSNTLAAESDLRAYFDRKGNDTDEQIRQYAARMIGLSNRAMDHLWAMKRLLNQFSPEEVRALAPEARDEWMGLIRSHCRSYQENIGQMRRQLHPVFFAGQSLGTVSQVSPIKDTNELTRAINQLFEVGSSNDRVIRSAFASASGGVMTTLIKTPQFWQSLNSAETLAATISKQ